MFTCPHCGKPGISLWDKCSIKLHDPAICCLCGGTATVSLFKRYLMGVPFLLTFAPMPFCTPNEVEPILCIVWALLVPATCFFGLILYLKKVPLVKVPRPRTALVFREVGPRWANRNDTGPPPTQIQRAHEGLSRDASGALQRKEGAGN